MEGWGSTRNTDGLTATFGCASQQHCMLDCHPFAEFILSEAEGLWASAYLVARNDDGTTLKPRAQAPIVASPAWVEGSSDPVEVRSR
jgi:hypothetical protein